MGGVGGRGLKHYDFDERRRWSEGFCLEGVEPILLARIPGAATVRKAEKQDDRNGTDYWVDRDGGLPALSVDLKARDVDFLKTKGHDDLALETWSVCDTKVGWTRDTSKRTDYVLWYWRDTGRFALVPFPPLCQAFSAHWREWRETYFYDRQTSGGWQSECVFVPRTVVFGALLDWMTAPLSEQDLYLTGQRGLLVKAQSAWGEVVRRCGIADRTVAALLRDSLGPRAFDGPSLVIDFRHDFHCQAVSDPKRRAVIEAALATQLGRPMPVRCELAGQN